MSHSAARNGLFQRRFVSDNPYHLVVHLDPVNHGSNIVFPKRNFPGGQILSHRAPETLYSFWIDFGVTCGLGPNPVQRDLGPVAIELETGDALFQQSSRSVTPSSTIL